MLEHERHRLANGTTVLTRTSQANDIVAVLAALPMGPLYETDEEAGISNLVQSLLSRGTEHRTAEAFQDELADIGAEFDASAGSDLGTITLKATRATWEDALDLYLEAVIAPAFESREVRSEITQTLGAIDAREDQLMTRAMDLFRETYYGEHPLHKPVIGYRQTVAGIDRDHIVSAAERFYRPVPPLVVGVGHFDRDAFVARLERALGGGAFAEPLDRPAWSGPANGSRRLELDRDAAYLIIGFAAPDLIDDEYAAARVVDAILGGSMSSRLFIELREKRSLAYQVSTQYANRLEGSRIIGYIVTDPARADEAASGLAAEFERIAEERVADDELDSARSYLRGRFVLGVETNMAQAGRLARYEAYGLGQEFGDRWLERVESVTADDVRGVAEKCFSTPATTAWVVPRGTPEFSV